MEAKRTGAELSDRLDTTFAALADSTRRGLLLRLGKGEASVSELAAPFAMSQPAISKHLKVLESAGLIKRERDAQKRPSKLDAGPLVEAVRWMNEFGESRESKVSKKAGAVEHIDTTKKKKKKNKVKRKKYE
jgi:DNA-binding transcriptional ArsR family regulator